MVIHDITGFARVYPISFYRVAGKHALTSGCIAYNLQRLPSFTKMPLEVLLPTMGLFLYFFQWIRSSETAMHVDYSCQFS